MNSLNALYFPTTTLWSLRQYPLFLLFPRLHILSAIEPAKDQKHEKETNSFIISGLCQEHTPSPLGADRSRFVRLLEDIKLRKDDYAAQLSALTLASFSAQKNNGEANEHEIINSMFIPDDIRKNSDLQNKQEQLWRSRLILAVGDLLDQEQEEIAFHMNLLEEDERELFQELQGEGDELDDEDQIYTGLSELRGKLNAPSPSLVKRRLKAWKHFLEYATTLPENLTLVTEREYGELLLETCEQKNSAAALLASFDLPAFIGKDESSALASIQTFRGTVKELADEFVSLVNALLEDNTKDNPLQQHIVQINNLAERFKVVIDEQFPEKKYGRRHLAAYLFPTLAPQELLSVEQPLLKSSHSQTVAFFLD